jgi:transcriptional regulator with AAA-type ATPase domain
MACSAAMAESPTVQAFLAIRAGERAMLVDLAYGDTPLVGPSRAALVRDPAIAQGVVRWDGERAAVRRTAGGAALVVNGKRLHGETSLRPGDELTVGEVRLVFGLAGQHDPTGRRALTHHEFQQRLAEELARAGRRARPTALAMVRGRQGEGARILETAMAQFRAGDVVATYAHDEVELLLPDTGATEALRVVGRVLDAAEAPGARAGVAVAPEDGDAKERMLWAARRALSAAVDGGARIARPPSAVETAELPLVAEDPITRALVARIEAIATGGDPVLLSGEASSGKGVFARCLHAAGRAPETPFTVLPCARLGDAARAAVHIGARPHHAGTLVLEEVCELPVEAQPILERWLEQAPTGLRLVATSHLDLGALVERGMFRKTLSERLAGEVLEVPPLRARPQDLLPLAEIFIAELSPEPVGLSPGALARLRSYPWPGNVRELRNAVERAVRLASDGEILSEHLPSDSIPTQTGDGRLREQMGSVERDAIVKALAEANHNQTHAAKRLGISRRALIYKMEKYGLKPPPESARR